MKIKNLILSTVLIFGSSSLTSFLINKKEVTSNKNSYTIDDNSITARLSTTFPGIVFHVKYAAPSGYSITGIHMSVTSDSSESSFCRSAFNYSDNLKFVDSDFNFVYSNELYSNSSNKYELWNWSKYLNKDNIFKNISYTLSVLDGFDNFITSSVNYRFTFDSRNQDNEPSREKLFTPNNLKLSDSVSNDYTRANIEDVKLNPIANIVDGQYGWFEGEIILDNEYTDIIKNDVKFYKGDDYQEYSDLKIEFDNTIENNVHHYTYKFLLKPYSYNEENKFKIECNLQYRASLNGDSSIPSVLDKLISKEFTIDNSIKTTLTKEQKINGKQFFNLNYLIKKPEEVTIEDIHISYSSDLKTPIDGFGPDKFKLDNGEFNLNGDIEFSIKSTKNHKFLMI